MTEENVSWLKMKEAFESAAAEMGGRAEVEIKVMYPGFKFGAGDHVVEIARKAADQIGRSCELLQSGGGSDANIIAGFGIPDLVSGIFLPFQLPFGSFQVFGGHHFFQRIGR